ncbi:hypothetical protein GF337_11410 [candidate division KSB1 bacterium]|nr:hypothetical protein [candidate division KSB1 bacterium]
MNSLEQNDIFKEDFTGALTYHTLDLGIMQYLESMRHFRYEVRMGVAFLEKGIQLNLDKFEDNTFYANRKISSGFPMPISFRFQTLFYMGLVEKANMEYADWVSLYVSFARHFAEKTPDFNCIGIGLRGDVSDSFSISAGISFVLASEFDSIPLKSSDDHLKLNFDGLQYHLLLIQYAF